MGILEKLGKLLQKAAYDSALKYVDRIGLYTKIGLNESPELEKLVGEIPTEPPYAILAAKFKKTRRSGELIHNVKLTNPDLIGIRWAVYGIKHNLAIGTTSRRIAREIADGNPVVRVLRVNHKKGTCTISAKV